MKAMTVNHDGTLMYLRNGRTPVPASDMTASEVFDVLSRLADYESSHLAPAELRESCDSVLELNKKLKPFLDAESDGRLLILPCKKGDKVYCNMLRCDVEDPISFTVASVKWDNGHFSIMARADEFEHTMLFAGEDVGTVVFRSPEELAEKG